mmetsp:Transcript_42882/g.102627  ORF Transcript_42882/g.102627 Transcript_42882/m.102627 type:complete len:663 (-) Transcript_42882:307-2295(-)
MLGCMQAVRLRSNPARSSLGLSPATLRFTEHSKEMGFIAQRKASLIKCSMLLVAICAVLQLAALAVKLVSKTHLRSTSSTGEVYQVHVRQMCALSANMALLILFFGVVSCKRLVERLGPALLEVAIVTLLTLTMSVGVMAWPTNISKMHGQAVGDVYDDMWSTSSDSAILLCIDTVVTGTHVGLPVRWHIMFIMEVVAVSLYAVTVFIIGSSEPSGSAIFNLVALTTLVFFSAVGRRVAEISERQAFLSVIGERSLRCEAEFRLSQFGTPAEMPRGQKLRSEARPASLPESTSSLPTASPSEQVFGPIANTGADDLSAHLACVADMCDAEHWRISEAEVTFVPNGHIGAGSFGQVVLGVFCGMMVAVKRATDMLTSIDVKKIPALCNELRILRHIRHPHMAVVYGALVDPLQHQVSLVMEFVQGETLKKFMSQVPSTIARVQVMIGVCRALLYLHTRSPQIVHGDLKGENVMVEVSGDKVHPKLLDFGLSRLLTRKPRPLGGTLRWVAPEVLLKDVPVGCSADVYSFGRLLAFVATGITPLAGMPPDMIKRLLKSRSPPFPKWPRGCVFKPCCKQLVHSCIRASPMERPDIMAVHQELLGLPQELGLASTCRCLANMQTVVAHGAQHSQEAFQTDPPLSQALESVEPDLPPEDIPEAALCSL